MRSLRIMSLLLVAACGSSHAGGTDGGTEETDAGDVGAPLFGDAVWQVHCQCEGGCLELPARDINHLDGEEGHVVECELQESGGAPVLDLRLEKVGEYGISLSGVQILVGSGSFGPDCAVTVLEGDQTLQGRCGVDAVSPEQPCQLAELRVDRDTDGNPQVVGQLLCMHLPSATDAATLREVTAPSARVDTGAPVCGPLPETEPVSFRVVNCGGV